MKNNKDTYIFLFILLFLSCSKREISQEEIYIWNKREFFNCYDLVSEPDRRINILHISDIHVPNKDAAINLNEAIRLVNEPNISINAIVCTGDLTNGLNSDVPKSDVLHWLRINQEIILQNKIVPLFQLGNHDSNDGDHIKESAITKEEQWANLFEPIQQKWSDIIWGDPENQRHYCYYDIDHALGKSIRVIMLDQLDHNLPLDNDGKLIYRCMEDAVFSQKQIDWFCEVALNVPNGYGIIVCNHFPFMEKNTKEHSLLIDGQFVQGWNLIPDIIQAWQNQEILVGKYNDIRGIQDILVNSDFRNRLLGSEFITYLVGHVHYRTHFFVNGYNQLLIMEDSAGARGYVFSTLNRVENSILSNTFSNLSIDREEGCIYRVSYGAYDENIGRLEVISYKK